MRHAHLFLGWVVKNGKLSKEIPCDELSIFHIFPKNEIDSSLAVFDFLKWLRVERQISTGYINNFVTYPTSLNENNFHR